MTLTEKELRRLAFLIDTTKVDIKDVDQLRARVEGILLLPVILVNETEYKNHEKNFPSQNLYKGWMIGEPFFADNCWKIHASKGDDHLYAAGSVIYDAKKNLLWKIDEWERRKMIRNESLHKALDSTQEPMKSTRQQILEDAIQCVTKDRNSTHGNPEDNFQVIAGLWNQYLIGLEKKEITGFLLDSKDVAALMILMKVSRLITSPEHMDHWTDIAGYAACGGEIASIIVSKQEETEDRAAGMELPK